MKQYIFAARGAAGFCYLCEKFAGKGTARFFMAIVHFITRRAPTYGGLPMGVGTMGFHCPDPIATVYR